MHACVSEGADVLGATAGMNLRAADAFVGHGPWDL